MRKKGKLIVFEGLDGAGKTTQLQMLQKYLDDENNKDISQIEMFKEYLQSIYSKNQQFELFGEYLTNRKIIYTTYDFPRYYTNYWGKMCARMLTGEFGVRLNPYIKSLFFLLDQSNASKSIRKDLTEGKMVICNRYITSSMIFQTGLIKNKKKKQDYLNWLIETGHNELKIIKPDIVIALYVDPIVAQELIKKKEERKYLKNGKDINETNLKIQINAANEMLRLTKEKKEWHLINCMDGDKIRSIEDIAKEIRETIFKYI